MTAPDAQEFRVLVVCTGNVCRSPQAAALLRTSAETAGLSISKQLHITSAGTHAVADAPMDPTTAKLTRRYGVADTTHRSHQLTPAAIEQADLVLCMSREHRIAVVRQLPRASRRVFLFTEFTVLVEDLVRAPDPRLTATEVPHQLAEYLRGCVEAAAARRGLIPKGSGEDEEIVDPYRREAAVYRKSAAHVHRTAQRLEIALRTLSQGRAGA